jgi:outer membrane protein insertion porin family
MKTLYRLALLFWIVVAAWPSPLLAQLGETRVGSVMIRHVGPPAVSDEFIRENIRMKAGDVFSRPAVDEDVKTLWNTGYFFKVQSDVQNGTNGVVLTYIVQGKPILAELKVVGNKKMSLKKIMKKITSKVNQPLDERKIFDDTLAIKELYEKSGYQKTTVQAQAPIINEAAGRGTVTFEIHETPKVRIRDVVFVNARAFPQKELRHVLKTRRHWMFSWLTGTGVLKEDEFEDDKEKLIEFYQNKGYIDFAIQDVKFDYITPTRMVVRFIVSEGKQYKVGILDIKGNKVFTTNDFIKGLKIDKQLMKLKLTPGATFTPENFNTDLQTLRDMYGARGFLERLGQGGTTTIAGNQTANPTTGKIDVTYSIEEGEKDLIEKIIIKGNVKTKDRVLRRELAVYPGEVYDMVRVKISKAKLEGLEYFSKVDTQTQDTDVPNRKDLVIGVEERNTGNVTVGAGFSSVESLVGFVELKQGNFDLFNPPTFTGAGQKFQIRASVGTLLQDYEISFVEPWFLGQKLALGVDLFHKVLEYNSLNNMYNEQFDGGTVSLKKALFGSPFLTGTVALTVEQAHVSINQGFTTNNTTNLVPALNGLSQIEQINSPNISTNIFDTRGSYFVTKFGTTLAYDTRNNFRLPNGGQITEISTEVATEPGDTDFYKVELRSAWYFKGFRPGHILELDSRIGVVSPYGSASQVPIFERWYLGGISSLLGYKYQTVGPEDQFGEPLGGDTYYFGSAEYSIPIVKMLRLAWFYQIGDVFSDPFSFNPGPNRQLITDDAGMGLRIILPLGGAGTPIRLDYGIPITHDPNLGNSGKFQFSLGYTHPF